MRHWQSVQEVPDGWTGCVVTIGSFDGVHRGHQAVIRLAVARARSLGLPVVVLTFDRHPTSVVDPARTPARLTTMQERTRLLAALGVDHLVVQPFTESFAALTPEEFVSSILITVLNANVVVEGADFRFGRFAAGTIDDLVAMGASMGFAVEVVEMHAAGTHGGTAYSSTLVRSLVSAGDVLGAGEVLGHPHRVSGVATRVPVAGAGRLVVRVAPLSVLPAPGAYRGVVHHDTDQLPARILIEPEGGTRGEVEVEVEVFAEWAGAAAVGEVDLDFLARTVAAVNEPTRLVGILP